MIIMDPKIHHMRVIISCKCSFIAYMETMSLHMRLIVEIFFHTKSTEHRLQIRCNKHLKDDSHAPTLTGHTKWATNRLAPARSSAPHRPW